MYKVEPPWATSGGQNIDPLVHGVFPWTTRPVASIKWLGGAERVAINSLPASVPRLQHTSWYMSDHFISLQYLLFLSLIFRLCWLWRNRELVWDIVRGKFAKQLLSVFFLPNEVISYVYKGQSICKNTISFIYSIPKCTEEQQYIILLWSTILWNFSFHWQLSILVEKFHFCSRI